MPRPNRGTPEKSKDFTGSMKKLLKNLKPWRVLLTLGLVLAFISAILSLVAPDHLSNLTDTITSGIKPNISENTIKDIMSNPNISYEDKMSFQVTLSSMNDSSDTTELLKKIDELPSSIYDIIGYNERYIRIAVCVENEEEAQKKCNKIIDVEIIGKLNAEVVLAELL